MTEQVVQDAATALTTELKAIDGAFDAGQEEALARAAIFALDKCRKLRVDALIAVTKDKHATIHDR